MKRRPQIVNHISRSIQRHRDDNNGLAPACVVISDDLRSRVWRAFDLPDHVETFRFGGVPIVVDDALHYGTINACSVPLIPASGKP